ncbi:hypothetical protein DIZ27_28850 [Streptomyces sp. NWU339]|nr:hypothetical protein DIZ27_28850 [Streptomyces sp. NWU339]
MGMSFACGPADAEPARLDPVAAEAAGTRCAHRAQTSAGQEQLSRAAAPRSVVRGPPPGTDAVLLRPGSPVRG